MTTIATPDQYNQASSWVSEASDDKRISAWISTVLACSPVSGPESRKRKRPSDLYDEQTRRPRRLTPSESSTGSGASSHYTMSKARKRGATTDDDNVPSTTSSNCDDDGDSFVNAGDNTPRPVLQTRGLFSNSSRLTSSPSPTKKSQNCSSPTKRHAARLNIGPTPHKTLPFEEIQEDDPSCASLLEAVVSLKTFSWGQAIIPADDRVKVKAAFPGRLEGFGNEGLYDTTRTRSRYGELPPIECVKDIVNNTKEAGKYQQNEAAWSHHVHNVVLAAALLNGRLGIRGFPVSYISCLSSKVAPEYLVDVDPGKMVDFTMFLDVEHLARRPPDATPTDPTLLPPSSPFGCGGIAADTTHRVPETEGITVDDNTNQKLVPSKVISTDILGAIRRHQERDPLNTLNHSSDLGLRGYALCVAIESKKPGEGHLESTMQITVWLRAHLRYLASAIKRRLRSSGDNPQLEKTAMALLRELPFLPGLIVQGPVWSFVALSLSVSDEQTEQTILWDRIELGSTRDAIGTYKIITAVQFLSCWSQEIYWPWFQRTVLGL